MECRAASALKPGEVFRLEGPRRGTGLKVVVVETAKQPESVGISTLVVRARGGRLGAEGLHFCLPHEEVEIIGRWEGSLERGAYGSYIPTDDGEARQEGKPQMAAKTKARKSTAKPKAKAEGRTRASNEELDALAAQVVTLRDDDSKSWGEIGEELDIAPGRLRSLYNRGGGTPTKKKQGAAAAKATDKPKGKSKASAGKRPARKRSSAA